MTDPLYNYTPVPTNLLLDLNLNMYLNPKTMVHGDMYYVKYGETDILSEPASFETLKQISQLYYV